jgi:hypothetical protein
MPIPLQSSSVGHSAPVIAMPSGVAVLTSWKDIANYLGKGVRTVQRWESDLGLPVRRPAHARKSVVFAVPAEINAWVRSQHLLNGPMNTEQAETAELLRQLSELQAENAALRFQLQLIRAKPA